MGEIPALQVLDGVDGAGGQGCRGLQRLMSSSLAPFSSFPHLLPAFAAFLLTACLLDFQRALALFVLTCVVLAFLAHSLLKRLLGPKLLKCVMPLRHSRLNLWLKR